MKLGPYLNRAQAMALGAKFYLAEKSCCQGHDPIRQANRGRACVQCHKDRKKKYWEENPEPIRAYNKAYNKAYREKNREKLNALRRLDGDLDPDKTRALKRLWADQNRDKKRLSARLSYRRRREKCLINASVQNARRKGADGSFTKADIEVIWERQGGLCVYCRSDLNVSCQIDHIWPVYRGGPNWSWNLQLACSKCNQEKSYKLPCQYERYRSAA